MEKSYIPFSGKLDAPPVVWCLALVLKTQVAEPMRSGGMQVDVLELV